MDTESQRPYNFRQRDKRTPIIPEKPGDDSSEGADKLDDSSGPDDELPHDGGDGSIIPT